MEAAMSVARVSGAGSFEVAREGSSSHLSLLREALDALNQCEVARADVLISQLGEDVSRRLFYLVRDRSGRPMGHGSTYGQDAFFNKNGLSLDAGLKIAILEQFIRDLSTPDATCDFCDSENL